MAFAIRKFLQHGVQKLVEILLYLFTAHRAVYIQHQCFVIPDLVQDVQKRFGPCIKALAAFHRLGCIFRQDPVHQIVNILEVVVEGHAVHAAILGDIVDRDLIEGLFQQQLFQRCFQCPLRCL